MQNVSKPSGEKGTGLLRGQFHEARLRLTFLYVALLALILLLSSGSIYSLFSNRIEYRFARFRPRPQLILPNNTVSPSAEEVRADLINAVLIVNGFLLVGAGIASYWLAGITLEPIQAMYHRQRRFLSDASHELRTPLAILQTDLENELTTQTSHQNFSTNTHSHLEEVQRMGQIVTDLLTLSRLDEKEEAPLRVTNVNIGQMIEETIDRLHSITERHGITIHFSPPSEQITAPTHKELLVHVLSNVIKNAITYNQEQGSVLVSLNKEGKQIVIRVVDTGIGIAQKDLVHIFDRFYRADESRSRETGGSGLGLAIVQSAMKQLHGSVQIKSTVGVGTTITLRFPLQRSS